jgi:ABC-type antimicrobial peptide transport system permease subunit
MGMNKMDVMKLTVYESLSNNLASILCGFVIGLLVAVGSIGQFLLFLELPFKVVLPYNLFWIVALMSVITMSLGSFIGTRQLYSK